MTKKDEKGDRSILSEENEQKRTDLQEDKIDLSPFSQVADRLLHPLTPIPTGFPARISPMQPRAMIFDIYGTLLISAAGDVGPDSAKDDEQAFLQALVDGGWDPALVHEKGTSLLQEEIHTVHREKRAQGVRFPEIDILQVWHRVLIRLGLLTEGENRIIIKRIRLTALSYECRTNPVWPMPGLLETLTGLLARGFLFGILSNAQFYTPILFETLCNQSLTELGFDPKLCLFSYREGEGKPAPNLFSRLNRRLSARGIKSSEVLYVGNDMLKDIHPAAEIGWKTALFAGDERSLRLREDEPCLHDVQPTLVIDDLRQLVDAAVSRP